MKFISAFVVLLLGFHSTAQGLNGEIGMNDSYLQTVKSLSCVDEFTFLGLEVTEAESGMQQIQLAKIDTNLNFVWKNYFPQEIQYEGNDFTTDFNVLYQIIETNDGGIFAYGYSSTLCDVLLGSKFHVSKISASGNVEWLTDWSTNQFDENASSKNLCFDGTTINLNLFQYSGIPQALAYSKIYSVNPTTGAKEDSLSVTIDSLRYIHNSSFFRFFAAHGNSLLGFDAAGNIQDQVTFSLPIDGLIELQDTIIVLAGNAIYSFQENFSPITSVNLVGTSNRNLKKSSTNEISFINGVSISDFNLITMDSDLNLISSQQIVPEVEPNSILGFSASQLSVANDFNLAEFGSVRLLNYSLLSTDAVEVNRADVKVVDLDIYSTTSSLISSPNIYAYSVAAKVLIKNEGNHVLESVIINHNAGPNYICGLNYYQEKFDNLNLSFGDSIWIDLGSLNTGYSSFPQIDNYYYLPICVYSSNPNGVLDLNVTNDKICENAIFGYVGLEELNSSSQKQLVRIVDLLGREISMQANQLLIFQYSDGSSEKFFVAGE